jgi:hypothetical protein
MAVNTNEFIVNLLHDEPLMVDAEGSDEIVVCVGVNVELGVAIDGDYRGHYERRHFDPHADVYWLMFCGYR